MEEARCWMQANQAANCEDYSWEERAFAEDAAGMLGGCVWPPRSYSCTFCRREFRSAQALGGHMNVHRRDRARLKQFATIPPNNDQKPDQFRNLNQQPSIIPHNQLRIPNQQSSIVPHDQLRNPNQQPSIVPRDQLRNPNQQPSIVLQSQLLKNPNQQPGIVPHNQLRNPNQQPNILMQNQLRNPTNEIHPKAQFVSSFVVNDNDRNLNFLCLNNDVDDIKRELPLHDDRKQHKRRLNGSSTAVVDNKDVDNLYKKRKLETSKCQDQETKVHNIKDDIDLELRLGDCPKVQKQ